MSPLTRFTYAYFGGGLVLIALYGTFIDAAEAWFLAVNWLAVGVALALIRYGMPRKDSSDVGALTYYVGIAWLVFLLLAGIVLFWNTGIGVEELRWLLGGE